MARVNRGFRLTGKFWDFDGWHGRGLEAVVFAYLMAHADEDGVVEMHTKWIAVQVGFSERSVKAALLALERGEEIARLQDHIPWGWFVVHLERYRRVGERRRGELGIKPAEQGAG